jgi:hypothetical protein
MNNQIVEGVDFYYEDGFMVLTEKYHLEKGYCCGHACKHCPFDFESVPEPKKSIALEIRNADAVKLSA